ncbi:MAG TPA: hypothetical protein PLC79_01800 [Phycisphaerae bacterium]|nr:hypothetical protein [Phycisphaerae bacterium]
MGLSMGQKESTRRPARDYGPAERARPAGAMSEVATSLPDIVRVAVWRRWYILIAMGVGASVTLASSLYWPREYTARCIIERYDDLSLSSIISANSPFGFATYRLGLPVELQGFEAVKSAIEAVGLSRGLPRDSHDVLTLEGQQRLQQLAEAVAKKIDLAFLQKSDRLDLVEITFRWSDPVVAQRLLAKLKDNYIERTLTQIRQNMEKARDFFDQEEKRYAKELAAAEKELDRIKVEVGGDPTSPGFLEGELNKLESEKAIALQKKREHDRALRSAQKSLAGINEMLAGGTTQPSASAPVSAPTEGAAMIAGLEQEIRTLEDAIENNATFRKMRPEHPEQESLVRKLERKRAQLAKAKQEWVATSAPATGIRDYQSLLLEKQRLENHIALLQELIVDVVADIKAIDAQIAERQAKKPDLVEAQQKWRIGTKVYEQALAEHKRWQDWRDQVQRFLSAEVSKRGIQLSTKEEPQPVLKASSPTFMWVLIIALVVGAGCGATAAVLAEFFDRSFRTSTQVSKSLGIPVLESIDEVVTPQVKWRRFVRRAIVMPAVGVMLLVMVASTASVAYVSLELPQLYQNIRSSPAAALDEMVRSLRMR